MPQLTHDTADDGFHEIQLSGKQLVFLFMVTTVTLALTFLCGVLVGRGVRTERDATPPVEAAAGAPAPTDAGEDPRPEVAGGEPPAPVADPELTYHERLQQEKTKEDLPQAQPQETKPAPAPPPPATPAAVPPPEPKVDVPTSGRPGAWVVQVLALSNRDTASSIVKRLISKGYPAFLLQPAPGAPVMYRVQIGRYKDRSEADQVARRLEKEEQFKPEIKR